MHDLFNNVWGDKEAIEIDNITDLTVPVSSYTVFIFYRINKCSFRLLSW